ncbi:MAG: aspartate-semialdehyde dehydrogenase [Myxococcales bacterium]|nr:aspartate-semialdehyde dehydrogenase [Myxococcales bacterium]MCB9525129.1 aspartate-semialdehyde dehydrogenase [Myxococcales bacterium]
MTRVAFIGWRGMVGSVLLARMQAEGDFKALEPVFFSTSAAGGDPPDVGVPAPPLGDAHDLEALADFPVIVTCQGGDYTKAVHPRLRAMGWRGYWIDAASALRMAPTSTLILDPVNGAQVQAAIAGGARDLIGANCTVGLMLVATVGLFRAGLVEWVTAMTYQAASGAGAANMRELVEQMGYLAGQAPHPAEGALALDRAVQAAFGHPAFPDAAFGHPLAGNVLPWIDTALPSGQSREEWKAQVEANKLLGLDPPVPIDGTCVRVGALRCHSQGLTIKLKKAAPLDEIEALIAEANPWVEVVPNTREDSLARLTPAAVGGTLRVPIGRLRKMTLGDTYLNAFTVGDQLLWGAAEPLRCALQQVLAVSA